MTQSTKKHLVIVESPAKAKTIVKYLGKNFTVLASFGHVRDLVPKEGAVDPENQFAMKYQAIDRNKKHIDAIATALKKADTLYLAPDPDREGEAIAWHIHELMKSKKLLKDKPVYRVAFNQITKRAVQEAIENPREIAQDLVNSQQTRRALDYLVGFNLSPLLWKKIRRGLSAGRVQSPALRLIAERELEIRAFEKKEYWSIVAKASLVQQAFDAKLIELNQEKVKQFTITNEKNAQQAKSTLLKDAGGQLVVENVEKKKRKRNPSPPFITSTLQQEAVRKLGFSASKTMQIAQQLYEGIDIGEGVTGLITYMRTDSVHLAQEALDELRQHISSTYGADSLPAKPHFYKTKSKNAQEAHEAIRPTVAHNTPTDLKKYLSNDQFKLYQLIHKRTVACQMIHATLNLVAIDLRCGKDHLFRATGSTIETAGFMKVYQESLDDKPKESEQDNQKILPEMKIGDLVDLIDIVATQHFTEPPPRYSEATLIKALEAYGIGRPSTYAAIISTLKTREYVTLEQKRFAPTDVGEVVNKFLTNYFTQYVDYDFTAQLEDKLDAIARGETEWIPVLDQFWNPFINKIADVGENVSRADVTQEKLDENCPECKKPLSIRLGKRGRFIGCTGYPDCSYTKTMDGEEQSQEPEVVDGQSCPKCDSELHIKLGRYGKFIGCSAYPKCKHIEPLEKPEDTEVECPECKQSTLFKRKSRFGKIFYSCNRYPDCKYAVWNEPLAEICPDCQWPVLTIKTTKRRGTEKVCPQKECKYAFELEPPEK